MDLLYIYISLHIHRFITQVTFFCYSATVQHLGSERLRALKMDFGTVNTQLKFHTSWFKPNSGGTSANNKSVPMRSVQDTTED